MSKNAGFYRALADLVDCPGSGASLRWLVRVGRAYLEAVKAGDEEKARDVLIDAQADQLLRQAFDRGPRHD